MGNTKKLLLVGWDAADWKIIHKLIDEGKMPTVQRLVESGTMGNMATLFPCLSPMLWTSIATGKRPYKHGIYGFIEPTADGTGVQPMTNVSRKSKALWNILNQTGHRSIVVGWWPSHPAEPLNGVMVSDFYHKVPRKPGDPWTLMRHSIHPQSLLKILGEMRIHPSQLQPQNILPFAPRAADIDQDTDSRLSSLGRVICECVNTHRAAKFLLMTQEWDFAAIYYDAIDHFCHGFMRYHPPRQTQVSEKEFELFNNVVNQAYVFHDRLLAELLETKGEETVVILMSDHGFHSDHLRPKNLPVEPAGPAYEHRNFGIFVTSGPGIKKDHVTHGVNLLDITPTILSIFGLPIGEDMDGKPLLDIFATEPKFETISSWEDVEGQDGRHSGTSEIASTDAKEALEQLIALGYIDRPDKDNAVAVANCQCELDYNLARAYMDGGRFGDAIPLLLRLYNEFPLEFRFGLQLSICLKAMGRTADLQDLVDDLNARWRVASGKAKLRMRDVAALARDRKKQWQELKKIDVENGDKSPGQPPLARVDHRGKPVLFSDSEKSAIRKVRVVARGNPQVIDFLAATTAAGRGEFEEALALLQKAEKTSFGNPAFHSQLGNIYLGLKRYRDAAQAFFRALEIDEFYPEALLGMCRTCLEDGKPGNAVNFGTQAVGLKFHFPLAHYFLAMAQLENGSPSAAINSCNTAIVQNPNFAQAHRLLADIFAKSGEGERADTHRRAANDLEFSQDEYIEHVESIALKPAGQIDFSQIVPEIAPQESEEFLRCLAQPRSVEQLPRGQMNAKSVDAKEIIVVSGLPRSGTSMMMQMLIAGGLQAYTDDIRKPDDSNPRGYYESDRVKKLAFSNNWVADCHGKVLKVVAPLVQFLPQRFDYRVILINRDLNEILDSQKQMLERLNRTGGNLTLDRFTGIFSRQLQFTQYLLKIHRIPYIELNYSEVVADPRQEATKLAHFLPFRLNVDQMVVVVDPNLYREKRDFKPDQSAAH